MIVDDLRRTLAAWAENQGPPVYLADGEELPRKSLAAIAQTTADITAGLAVNKDEPVVMVIRNRPAHLAALFGLLAAGRPVRFINAFQAPQKIAKDIEALQSGIVLADETDLADAAFAELGGQGCAVIQLGAGAKLKQAQTPRRKATAMPGIAIEIGTSGTSGEPKRIGFSAATLTAALADHAAIAADMGELPAQEGSAAALIQYAPILHIAGLWVVLQAGIEGRPLVLLEKFTAAAWVEAVSRLRPAMAGMSPPLLRMVLELAPEPDLLASLVAIRCGSTALDQETRAAFTTRYGIPLLSVYGATEFAGIVAAWSLADHQRFADTKPQAAGRLRPHVAEARIGEGQLLELRVPRVSDAWQRSTDIASIDTDGFLNIHGRADHAITRGGFKILPDQLVAALRRHPAVADAAVVGLPDARLGQVPAAAVELRRDAQIDAAGLEAYMRAELPAYQVPTRFCIVEHLPRTPAAKIILPDVVALFNIP